MTEADPSGRGPAGLLRVLATTDLHGNLLSYDYYADRPDPGLGLSRVASLIAAAREEAGAQGAAVLLTDNGDGLQGTPLAEVRAGSRAPHPLMRAFGVLGYDAIGLGNHDFNYGLEALARTLADAPCPVLCANLAPLPPEPALPFTPSAVLERHLPGCPGAPPLRIGLLSVLPPQTVSWDAHLLQGRIAASDMVPAAAAEAARLKQAGCDVVIALAHTGIGGAEAVPGMENALIPLAALEGIDAVVGGHTHLLLPDAAHPFAKPVVMPGAHGSHLGVIDLHMEHGADGWRIAGWDCGLRAVAERGEDGALVPLADEDAAVEAALAGDHARTRQRMEQPVGKSGEALHSYFTFFAPDRGLALAAAAQAAAVRALIAGTEAAQLPLLSAAAPGKFGGRSGPGHYTDIAAGPLCMRHVADLHIFPNELRAVVVDGSGLRDWLEMSAGVFRRLQPGGRGQPLADPERAGHNFDVIFGLEYEIDVSAPPRFSAAGELLDPNARRIRNLRWQGAPVRPEQQFAVAVNSYRAGGGGRFAMVQRALQLPLPAMRIRDSIRNYLSGRLPADPLDAGPYPWRLSPLPGTRAIALTGPGARAHLGELPGGLAAAGRITPEGFLPLELAL
ncbi:5'-nucleotidase C-terminal domain-containing protein [Roseobacteraceae bacterium NS-SX3]